jgi:hypothetical protein
VGIVESLDGVEALLVGAHPENVRERGAVRLFRSGPGFVRATSATAVPKAYGKPGSPKRINGGDRVCS